jgi:preprotein translocase subunit YajC
VLCNGCCLNNIAVTITLIKGIDMYTLFSGLTVLQAQGDQTNAFLSTIVIFVPVFLIMYLLIIRPQSKKQKALEKMVSGLQKGDKVVTIGGVHGTVVSTKEHTVIVKVDDNCKLEFSRSAVATVLSREGTEKVAEKVVEEKKAVEASK